jgi:hypothetical protein
MAGSGIDLLRHRHVPTAPDPFRILDRSDRPCGVTSANALPTAIGGVNPEARTPGRIPISPVAPYSPGRSEKTPGTGARLADSTASSIDCSWEDPVARDQLLRLGERPIDDGALAFGELDRLPSAPGRSPARSTSTPAFLSSSLYPPIAVRSSSLGAAPGSGSPLIINITACPGSILVLSASSSPCSVNDSVTVSTLSYLRLPNCGPV